MQLTEKILAYQAGYWTWTDLWREMFLAMDRYLRERRVDPDLAAVAIGLLTPRLPAMVDHFTFKGKAFEAFLLTALRYQLKTVYAQRRKERERDQLWQSFDDAPLFAPASNGRAGGGPLDQSQDRPGGGQSDGEAAFDFAALSAEHRRLVVIALKNCNALSDRHIALLARTVGCTALWLQNLRDELRDLTNQRRELYRNLRARERALAFSVEFAGEGPDGPTGNQRRLQAIRRNLDSMNPFPRHQDIARLLGIPKGTVDSTLFYARKQIGRACQN